MANIDNPGSRPPAQSPAQAAAPNPRAEEDDGRISFDNLLGGVSSSRPSVEAIDLGSLVSHSDHMDAQIWMVQKNNLDHGPFSARELGQQVIAGRISADDLVLNMDSGVRQRCEVWPEFTSVVVKAREQRQREEEVAAQRKVEKVEKGVGYLRYLIAAGIVVLIGLGIGSYFLILQATRGSGPQTADEFADLVAAGILDDGASKSGRRGGGRRGGGRPGGGRGGMSAEEAMEQGVDYGDLSGGMTQLSVGQINSVMGRNARRFYPCLYSHRGRVTLDFVINGDGSVAGVSVPGADGALRSCMASRMQGIRFPAFGAPRMRASFYFEVGE
jgi:hypothetical protein